MNQHDDRILTQPQSSDPGTEGAIGYDYQREIAILLCVRMIKDHGCEYVVCEFHEDLVQIRDELKLELVQVKKNQSRSWTLENIIKPARNQKKGILGKLFEHVQKGKDVAKLAFWGHGRISDAQTKDGFSLAGLVSVLNMPVGIRDAEWARRLDGYVRYLSKELHAQGIDAETVKKGIMLLDINMSYPHPDAIEKDTCDQLENILKEVWSIELTSQQAKQIYLEIYDRVKKISHKPMQNWEVKSIGRNEIIDMVLKLAKQFYPALSLDTILTTNEKLTRVNLQSKTKYALQRRLDAMYLRYEIPYLAQRWEHYRAKIDIDCRTFREENPTFTGSKLWQGMQEIFASLGSIWIKESDDKRLDARLAEGLFFDMTGVCEAEWMRSENNEIR